METITIQSDINRIIDVESFITHICDVYNINNYAAIISVPLLQAVKNAIIHGNGSDSSKVVTIKCDRCMGGIYFTVSDQGVGFDYASFQSAEIPEGRGEGLFLIKTLSDKVSFADNGSTIRMDFFVSGISLTRALERRSVLRNFYSIEKVMV